MGDSGGARIRFFCFLLSLPNLPNLEKIWGEGDVRGGVLQQGGGAVEQCRGSPALPQPHMQAGPAPQSLPVPSCHSQMWQSNFLGCYAAVTLYKAAFSNKALFSYCFDLGASERCGTKRHWGE